MFSLKSIASKSQFLCLNVFLSNNRVAICQISIVFYFFSQEMMKMLLISRSVPHCNKCNRTARVKWGKVPFIYKYPSLDLDNSSKSPSKVEGFIIIFRVYVQRIFSCGLVKPEEKKAPVSAPEPTPGNTQI